jgi:hypothetical protein
MQLREWRVVHDTHTCYMRAGCWPLARAGGRGRVVLGPDMIKQRTHCCCSYLHRIQLRATQSAETGAAGHAIALAINCTSTHRPRYGRPRAPAMPRPATSSKPARTSLPRGAVLASRSGSPSTPRTLCAALFTPRAICTTTTPRVRASSVQEAGALRLRTAHWLACPGLAVVKKTRRSR